uniref:Telomeric repeat-binding factor 2-interacting protein 1 n=1 Tax=Oryzias melastigma TaxID=30732 RepID=A0A3B3DWS6_ORYME
VRSYMELHEDPESAIQNISPVLFLTFDGEPMTFYLRPGHTRQQLQPMIKAGGGVMCRTQRPGAILLIDPEARSSVSGSNAHLYVSTQYILDCIEKEEQLNVEDYRLTPDDVPKPSTKKDRTKTPSEGTPVPVSLVIPYTPDDDTAILEYVKSRKARVGGILLWREMERKRVTGHSWQSMKDRYERRLAKKLLEAVTAESTENVTGSEAEEDQAESPVKASTPGKLKDKRKASPATDQPVQRMTRRRLELEAAASSEPYGRKLRSSSSSPAPSPQKSKKTNPVKAARENSPEAEQPPPKRARGNIPADLVSVTKALLKTSGDFSAALDLLLNPSSLSASIWSLHDDSLLLSADPLVRQQLQEKYGEESVAKRMMFLEPRKKKNPQ